MKLKQEQHLETAELHVEAISLIHPHCSNIQYFRVRYDWKAKYISQDVGNSYRWILPQHPKAKKSPLCVPGSRDNLEIPLTKP